MSEPLRAHIALPEDLSLVSSTCVGDSSMGIWLPGPLRHILSMRFRLVSGAKCSVPSTSQVQLYILTKPMIGAKIIAKSRKRGFCQCSHVGKRDKQSLYGLQSPLSGAWPEGRVWVEARHTQLNSPTLSGLSASQSQLPGRSPEEVLPWKLHPLWMPPQLHIFPSQQESPGEISNFVDSILSVKEGTHTSV